MGFTLNFHVSDGLVCVCDIPSVVKIVGKIPTPVPEQWTNVNMALFPDWYLQPQMTVHALVISFVQYWLHQKDIIPKTLTHKWLLSHLKLPSWAVKHMKTYFSVKFSLLLFLLVLDSLKITSGQPGFSVPPGTKYNSMKSNYYKINVKCLA